MTPHSTGVREAAAFHVVALGRASNKLPGQSEVSFYCISRLSAPRLSKAYLDRVEPVYFRISSHVGQVMLALPLVLVVYVLAVLTTFIRNWRARRAAVEVSKPPLE